MAEEALSMTIDKGNQFNYQRLKRMFSSFFT